MIKPIPYGKHFIDEEDIKSVIEVLKSDFLTQGKKVEEFEKALSDFHGCRYAVVFSNGTSALHGAYYASGIKPKDEFITTPITFAATANAGLYMGAVPVFCDVEPDTGNIDANLIEEKITDRTKVITPVSYAGNVADLKTIFEIAKKHNIIVIHDAAHALGARRDGYGITDFCHMAMVSFHPVKHVACGEGGVILTNSEKLKDKLMLFRNHGITKDKNLIENYEGDWYYEMLELGYNYRLTDIQCALGISQLKKAKESIIRRNEIAKKYINAFKNIKNIEVTKNKSIDGIHSYHLFPILTPKEVRKDFFDYMRNNGILVQIHYIPLHTMPYYKKNFGFKKGDFKNAELFYEREVSIPMFPSLADEQQDYVIETIKNYFGEV